MRCSWIACVLGLALGAGRARAQEPACVADEALSRAAAELLLSGQSRPDASQLTAAVRAAGSDAVALHALALAQAAQPSAEQTWLQALRARSDAELHCGRAQGESGRLLIASARAGELAAIDPGTRTVRGALAPGFTRGELVVAAADGQLVRVGVSPEVLARGVELEPDLVLPLQVQLLATGPAGPRPVAERWVGAQGGATESGRPPGVAPAGPAHSAVGDPAQADLGRLLGSLRDARGRRPLRPNRLLREAAARHARAVCAQGRVAHKLEDGDGPEERLRQAHLGARLVGEAIARASDGFQAFEALQNSPSHLLTLLEPRFTDIGIGEAGDASGKRCFVVLLAAWPRKL